MGSNRELLALLLERERRKARTDFYAFTRWMFRQQRGYDWQHARHHQIICDALSRAVTSDAGGYFDDMAVCI